MFGDDDDERGDANVKANESGGDESESDLEPSSKRKGKRSKSSAKSGKSSKKRRSSRHSSDPEDPEEDRGERKSKKKKETFLDSDDEDAHIEV